MLDQAVASAQESVRYAREAKQDAVAELILLGLCEYYASGTGDIELSEAYEISRKGGRPSLVAIRELTEISAERGNIAGARAFVEESDRALQAQRLAATSPFLAKATADNAETHFFYEMSAGRYQAAEIWQRKAVENWRAFLTSLSVDSNGRTDYNLGSFHRHFSVLHAELARSLMAQLRSTEAETVARDGLVYALQHTGRSSPGVVIAAESLGQALFAQGRVADAERVFATVTEIREELGIPADNGRNWTANAMAMQSHWTEALLLYNDAKQSRTPGDPYVVFPRVMALYHVERSAEGLALIQPLAERRARTYGENSADTALAKGFVGVGLALQGETRRAMATFDAVLPLLLRSDLTRGATEESGNLNHEFRRYVLEAYLGELSKPGLKSGQFAVATAFQVTDSLRVAVTDRAVAASVARANLRDPGLADVARREQDTLAARRT
jgi:tetratricopeptide (TPR) repeat protein